MSFLEIVGAIASFSQLARYSAYILQYIIDVLEIYIEGSEPFQKEIEHTRSLQTRATSSPAPTNAVAQFDIQHDFVSALNEYVNVLQAGDSSNRQRVSLLTAGRIALRLKSQEASVLKKRQTLERKKTSLILDLQYKNQLLSSSKSSQLITNMLKISVSPICSYIVE